MESKPLPLHVKTIYGLGDHSINVALVALAMIFPFYLTEVVGMRVGLAGLVPLVGRVTDAISDVLMGRISDRTTWKAGRRRPYLLIGAVPFAVSFAALWAAPPIGSTTLQFAYYAGLYAVISLCMTVVAVPYQAILPELTDDYQERTSLATFRAVFSILGTLFTLVVFRPLAQALGGDARAWQIAGIVLAVWIVLPWYPIWRVTWERGGSIARQESSTREYFALLFRNRSFRRLIGLFTLGRIAIDLPLALFLHYFTYVIGRPEDFETVMGVFLVAVAGAMPAWLRFSRGRDKASVYRYGCVGWVFGLLVLFVAQPEWSFAVTLFATALAGIGYSAADMIPWSMVADVADEDELASGERREGLYVGVFTFTRKIAGATGVAAAFLVLDLAGFRPGERNDEVVVWTLRAMTALVPSVFVVLSALVAGGYALGRTRHRAILDELESRRIPAGAPGA
ncbi:glycoside-pentoside-hexuronide (GPH):cation symporter [Myxococcota bacterium]|nr:glycoside-pentoside-hexuronide (GPH):cation symporter [Myxococcota bacterium]